MTDAIPASFQGLESTLLIVGQCTRDKRRDAVVHLWETFVAHVNHVPGFIPGVLNVFRERLRNRPDPPSDTTHSPHFAATLLLRFIEWLFISNAGPVFGLQLLADLLYFTEDAEQVAT